MCPPNLSKSWDVLVQFIVFGITWRMTSKLVTTLYCSRSVHNAAEIESDSESSTFSFSTSLRISSFDWSYLIREITTLGEFLALGRYIRLQLQSYDLASLDVMYRDEHPRIPLPTSNTFASMSMPSLPLLSSSSVVGSTRSRPIAASMVSLPR